MPANSTQQGTQGTQDELRQRLLGGIIASAMDAIITIDSSQRVVFFNPAAERMFQLSAEEAVGQPLDRFIPERFREAHRRHIEEFGRTGVSTRHMGALSVVKGLRADGGEFPAEASISQVEAGGQKFYTAIVRDVSERESAALTRRRLVAIVENSEDAILSKNLDGLITSWNTGAERLFGYTAGEILGESIMRLLPPDRQAEEAELLERLRLGQRIPAYETVWQDRAGRRIDVSRTLSPLRNAAADIVGASSIVRDIRQRVQMERALEESEKVAHRQLAELRNIYECAPVGLAFIDKDLRFAAVNEQLARLSGRSPEALLGRHLREVLPEVAGQLEPLCRRVLQTEAPLADVEVSAPAPAQPGGLPREWLTSYFPIRNSLLWGLNLVVSEISERRRAERALLRSEHRFDAFMAHLPAAAWIKDLDGRYIYVNHETERIFSKPSADILGRTDEQLFPPETARRFRDNDRRALAEGGAIQTVEVLRQADGIEHHSIVSKFVLSEDGRPAYIAGVAFDITERERAELELALTRDQLAAKLAAMNRLHELGTRFLQQEDLNTLFEAILDAAIAITGASKGNVQLLDTTSGELGISVQHGFDAAFVEFFSHIHPGQAACGTALQTRQCVIVEDITLSPLFLAQPRALQLKLAAGVRAVTCTPLLTRAGRLVGVLSVHFPAPHHPSEPDLQLLDLLARQAADFIERTQAEQALRENEARLRLAVETAELGTYERDLLTNQITVNPACRRILAVGEEALPPDVAYRSVHPEDKDRVLAAVARAFNPALREVCAAEFRILRPDGTVRWVAGRGRVIFDDTVNPARACKFLGVLLDITERKLAEEELLRAKEDLSRANAELERRVNQRTAQLRETLAEMEQLSYSIIHDLRAPLRAIQSFGSILEQDPETRLSEQGRDLVAKMRAATSRMDRLVVDVLDYSKVVRGELPLGPVDVGALARGIVETYPELGPSKAEVRVAPDMPPVLANEAALTQCLSQLLANAVRFARPGVPPQIRIYAQIVPGHPQSYESPEPQHAPRNTQHEPPPSSPVTNPERFRGSHPSPSPSVRIIVEDNGVGIPAELHAKIFEIFQRLSSRGEGTGMGLAIVKKAAERMGGRVGVESEPGRGSKFWIELHLAQSHS